MITLGNRISTTTRNKLLPVLVDTILNSNVFASRMLKKAKKWSGKQIEMPIKVSKNTTTTSWSGFDQLATSATDNRQKLTFDPGFVAVSSVLPIDELSVNGGSSGEEAILDLVALTVESDAQDLADTVGTQFWADGTGNSSKDLQGLGAIVDDGSAVATYGGLSRSTYTTIQSTVTASSGTLTLAKMATLGNNVTSGTVKPTAAFATEAVFSFYEQLLVANERYMLSGEATEMGSKLGTGAVELAFRGFPIMRDEKATSGVLAFLNENFISWYGLKEAMAEEISYNDEQIEGNDYSKREMKSMGFNWGGWIKPANQKAIIGFTTLAGQLTCSNPKRQGKLTGITGV